MSKTRINHTNNLHAWLDAAFNDPFSITLTHEKNVYIEAPYKFDQLLKYNKKNQSSFIRQRSKNKQNILHFLFDWKMNRDKLNQDTERPKNSGTEYLFSTSHCHRIFLLPELQHKLSNTYPDKASYSKNEYISVVTRLIKEKADFYFASVEDFFRAMRANVIKSTLEILSSHPDALISMLTERDDNEKTPLHYLSSGELLSLISDAIKTLHDNGKREILFAADDQNNLFLHFFFKKCRIMSAALIDTFGEAEMAHALIQTNSQKTTSLHVACANQDSSFLTPLFQLLVKYQLQSALLIQDDTDSATPLIYIVKNTMLDSDDINKIFSLIDYSLLDQIWLLRTKNDNTLFTHLILNNRKGVIKSIQQYIDENKLILVLAAENKSEQNALRIAYEEATLDTFRAVMQLFSPVKALLCGVLATSPLLVDKAKHLSLPDTQKCIKEMLGLQNMEAFKLCMVLYELIHPEDPANHVMFIKEVMEVCACIAQGRRLPKARPSTFSLFAVNHFPDLENKLSRVTAEQVDFYLNKALPSVKPYVSPEKQRYIEMILHQFHAKMQHTMTNQQALVSIVSPIGQLYPVYDSELENRWRQNSERTQIVAEREQMIEAKMAELTQRENQLIQHEPIHQMTAKPSFSLTMTLIQISETAKTTQPVHDVLERRQLDCDENERKIVMREQAAAIRENKSALWEAQLKKREWDVFSCLSITEVTYQYSS